MGIADTRRENARKLVKENGGTTAVAKKLGYRNPSFLSQILGPKPTRELTEKTARSLEEAFNLAPGSLDHGEQPAAPQALSTALVADVIKMVGNVLESEGVALGPAKFSELIAMALVDTMDHGGQVREGQVRTVAKLLK